MELDKYTILDTQLIEQAIKMIELNSSRCVIVINTQKKVVGILSEGDILRAILKGVNIKSPVKNITITNFKYLTKYDDKKIKSYFKNGITLIPIINTQNILIDVVVFTHYVKNNW